MHKYVVLLSTFLCMTSFGGMLYGTPLMLVAILDTFHVSRVKGGLVSAMMSMFCDTSGIVASTIEHKYGPRKTGAMGAILMTVPFCIAFFATSLTFLVVTAGVLAGTGLGFIFLSCPPAVCEHFQGNAQVLALTFVAIGSSVGAMSYAYLIELLIDAYGLRGTCLIMGGIAGNILVLTLLWTSPTSSQHQKAVQTTSINIGEASATKQTNVITFDSSTIRESFKSMIRNKSFVCFAFGNTINMAVHKNVYIYIVDTVADKHNQESLRSLAPLLFSLAGMIGRLMCGFLKQLPHYSVLDTPLMATVFGLVGCLLLGSNDSISVTLFAWCLNGIAMAVFVASVTIAVSKILGKHNLATGMGVITSFIGVLNSIGGPLNGYIRDITGTYKPVFFSSAALIAIGGAFLIAAKWYRLERSCGRNQLYTLENK